ncbi:MAG: biotin--[acetyl-CoA-carboxylase] ligase [Candidatus Cloacimonas sp.]|jgi:BirA family biotin operon repressor/biotin-[acetyl-CoA-carboxylase] ligase|nr:biotin--[acetyl-CoA-carboxylase] ligase [Candidatus Cloacimonas sp.]
MRSYFYYDKLDSTMNEYQRLKELNDGLMAVRAGTQDDGIGRADHLWLSPPGGLWFSFDVHYDHNIPSFALFTGYCLHRCLEQMFSPLQGKLKIKWTNDIMYNDNKLGGILCRYQPSKQLYTIGIGINTNNTIDAKLGKFGALSLSSILGHEISNPFLYRALIKSIEGSSSMMGNELAYLTYCNEHLFGKNRWAIVEMGGLKVKVEIIGINNSGALIIRKEMGEFITMHTGSILEFLEPDRVFLDR